jgi:hypothetical protein
MRMEDRGKPKVVELVKIEGYGNEEDLIENINCDYIFNTNNFMMRKEKRIINTMKKSKNSVL